MPYSLFVLFSLSGCVTDNIHKLTQDQGMALGRNNSKIAGKMFKNSN